MVLVEPAAAVEPSKGALDDPTFWQDGKALLLKRLDHHLDAQLGAVSGVGGAALGTIDEGVFKKGKARPQRLE